MNKKLHLREKEEFSAKHRFKRVPSQRSSHTPANEQAAAVIKLANSFRSRPWLLLSAKDCPTFRRMGNLHKNYIFVR